jgi:hypothetical protein
MAQWLSERLAKNPLTKIYGAPASPFAREYTVIDIEPVLEMDKDLTCQRTPHAACLSEVQPSPL